VPTTGEHNYHTTRQKSVKYDKNKHASLAKNTYNTKPTHTQNLKPGLLTLYDIWLGNGMGLFW